MRTFAVVLLVAVVCSCTRDERTEVPVPGTAKHQSGATPTTPGHAVIRPDQMKWQPGPPSLPPGAQFVVLEGDPAKEGFFAMRVRMPSGYTVPPHTHPKTERVTVISG